MRGFAHVNTARCNGRLACARRIAFGGDGTNGREPFHVVAFSCAVCTACEFTVRKPFAARAVRGAVLYVSIGEGFRGERVLIGSRFACNNGALVFFT